MIQLVYSSIATRILDADEMAALCDLSSHNNRRVEITGILLARGSRYLQTLEGPKEEVENTFLRIIRDPRHHHLLLFSRRVTTRREFGDWDMACYDEAAGHQEIVGRVARLTQGASEPIQRAFAELLEGRPPRRVHPAASAATSTGA